MKWQNILQDEGLLSQRKKKEFNWEIKHKKTDKKNVMYLFMIQVWHFKENCDAFIYDRSLKSLSSYKSGLGHLKDVSFHEACVET